MKEPLDMMPGYPVALQRQGFQQLRKYHTIFITPRSQFLNRPCTIDSIFRGLSILVTQGSTARLVLTAILDKRWAWREIQNLYTLCCKCLGSFAFL